MHIPDGYLSPLTCAALFAAMLPAWSHAAKSSRKSLSARRIPEFAMAAAFSFLLMMFNIPIPGGSSGHAVGAALIAILLGPWPAVLALSMALVVQALLFGDGGLTAIGANCFNMALVMPLSAWAIFRLLKGSAPLDSRRALLSGAAAGYGSICLAALCAGVEFGLQPLIARQGGLPLYCPFPLSVTIPAMLGEHLLVFGWVEAIATAAALAFLAKTRTKSLEEKKIHA